jgi:hypothetical protein
MMRPAQAAAGIMRTLSRSRCDRLTDQNENEPSLARLVL